MAHSGPVEAGVNWDWSALLAVGALSAGAFAALAAAVRREAARLRLVRAEVRRLHPELQRVRQHAAGRH
ncbi:MAG TPA: hypothetical protein VME46_18205 [Acidimicrobiales bacterium]|nr:hypothetical protein [Acidimicrobiales bacterium]